MMKFGKNEFELTILIAITWILIYLIYISASPNIFKVSIALIMLFVSGKYIEKKYSLDKELSVFLLWKNRKYITLLKKLTLKLKGYFLIMADSALFIAFGLLAFYLIKWRTLKEKILLALIGYTILYVISLIYSPSVYLLMLILGIRAKTTAASSILSLFPYLTFVFGLATTSFVALLLSSFSILIDTANYLFFGAEKEISQGVTLLLPGINIPFLEGVLALIVILIVHEFSHGILAIAEKIKVKSMGIVSFGTVPIGAFVEPDEKMLERAGNKTLSRVLVAGVASNFIFSIIFFTLLIIFLKLTVPFSSQSCLILSGSRVVQVEYSPFCTFENGYATSVKGEKISLDGEFESFPISKTSIIRNYKNPLLQFIYNFLLLSSSLNLVVGIINLIPIPFFDGDMLSRTFLPQKLHKVIRYAALASLLVSLLPGIL